jgi:hypothetical protein
MLKKLLLKLFPRYPQKWLDTTDSLFRLGNYRPPLWDRGPPRALARLRDALVLKESPYNGLNWAELVKGSDW